MTFDGNPAFWHWVEHCDPKCLGNLLISWCHAHIQGTQCQMQHSNPKTSLNLLNVWLEGRCSFLWRLHFVFCKQRDDVLSQKVLIWSHLSLGHSPRRILACSGVFWQTPVGLSSVSLSAVGSSWVSYQRSPFHRVGDGWCELKLSYLVFEGQVQSGSWLRFFLHHSNNPSLQSSIKFSLAATSREVGYSAMGLKLPDNIVYGGHRSLITSRSLEMDL